MQGMEQYNPFVFTAYILMTAGISMFCMNPFILLFSIFGAVLFYLIRNGRKNGKQHGYWLLFFLILAFINPLVSHNGVTVLFVMNQNPITLEALIYGIAAATMILSVIYWFRSYTEIMTSDRLLYVFGFLSPKLALVLSMSLRYVSLFSEQAKKVNQTQKALGLYKEDNIVDTMKGKLRVFSILLTWALENGIITADSMQARGYGKGKRSRFTKFQMRKQDVVFILLSVLLFVGCVLGIREVEVQYYPAVRIGKATARAVSGYVAYALLACLPAMIEIKEKIKWKYLESKM